MIKKWNEYLNESCEVKSFEGYNFINEGRIASMSDAAWLSSLYCHQGSYINSIYDSNQNYAMYGVRTSDVEKVKEILKLNKGINKFRVLKANDKTWSIICFNYTPEKDQKRQEAIKGEAEEERKAAELFQSAVSSANTSLYNATAKDIEKMKAYYNKRSNPDRLVSSIKDNSKLVGRWIAAIKIDWPEAAFAFSKEIQNRGILTKAEIVAYTERYKTEAVDDNGINRLDAVTKKIAESWITRSVYLWLESLPYEIEWIESFKSAKTEGAIRKMNSNGRIWPEWFKIRVTNGEKSTEIGFDIVTDEAGKVAGYCLSIFVVSLKQFKEDILRLIKSKIG